MRYVYSNNVVYNNFVWIKPSDKQRRAIELSAKKILDVRANYSDATFAELYDEVTMPYELRQAHRKKDLTVARAYGWENLLDDEPSIAVKLLKIYDQTR